MSVAFLFPGQGSQQIGMFGTLDAGPTTRRTFEEASEVLGLDSSLLDSAEQLESSENIQMALLISGVAAARAVEEAGGRPDLVAGLSLGAFTAAVVAGVLSFADSLLLVRMRGRLMREFSPAGYGMAVLEGLTEAQIQALLAHSGERRAYLANLNAERQMVITGPLEVLANVMAVGLRQGAHRAELLNVPVASHCAPMQPVADALTEAFQAVSLRPPRVPYLSNRRARPLTDAQAIAADLSTNVAHPVRWYDAVTVAFELGARLFLEATPGHALSHLAGEAFPESRALPLTGLSAASAARLIRAEQELTPIL